MSHFPNDAQSRNHRAAAVLRHGRRFALHAVILVAAASLPGCPPAQKPAAILPAATTAASPVIGTPPTAGGIFVPLESHDPLQGEPLKRALMTRAQILAATRSSPQLTATSQPASTQSATTAPDSEPPPLAVKYYLQGREKFLDGANSEAMNYLDKALALDPNAFTVLRLMGRVCFASSQLARGSLYLQRAYSLDPADVEVNYLLGRYWLERKESDRAVANLLQADDSPERSPTSAQTPLVTFYLARAMQAAGYHKEAAAEFETFLATIELPIAGYRYDRELNYLIEESWAAHLAAAENLALIGDFKKAAVQYIFAARHEHDNAFIAGRLANALIHLNAGDQARQVAMKLVNDTAGSADSIELLAWTYKTTNHEKDILPDLRARIKNSDDIQDTLTLAAAQDFLGQKSDAFETIRVFAAAHPADLTLLARLIKRVDSPATFQSALLAAAEVLEKHPDKNDDILKLFLPLAAGDIAAKFTADLGAQPEILKHGPYAAYLLGETCSAQRNLPLAETCYKEAALAPKFFPAREAFVATLTAEEKFKDAADNIKDAIAHNEGGAKSYQLLIDSEADQEHLANALKIAREAKAKFPDDSDIRLELAAIYRLRGDDNAADNELIALIDGAPKFEPAFRTLINSSFNRANDARKIGQGGEKLQLQGMAYLSRLMREIPGSVYGRITTALFRMGEDDEQAEAILKHVLADEPDNTDALDLLAEIRQRAGNPAEAAETLAGALKSHPSAELVALLADLYRTRQDKPAEALALTEKYFNDNPGNDDYAVVYANELDAQKKSAKAIAVLADAVQKFPKSQQVAVALARLQSKSDKPADGALTMRAFIDRNGETVSRLLLLGRYQALAGLDAEDEATLERVLVLNPDHAGANNDLGYMWADEGKNLDRAEAMIKKALEDRPNDSAFLDSLAWVYYKQGKFDKAIAISERAIAQPLGMEPEVLQHLADALYRSGKTDEANERWNQARSLLSAEDPDNSTPAPPLTKDKIKVKNYLDAAIEAMKSGNDPALSPLGKDTAAPATSPH